jgi:hypothetical protein
MSLFLHKTFPVKSTCPSPPLCHQENAPEKYQFSNEAGNIYVHCVFRFSIVVSVGPQKYSLVWYTLKHGVAHNPVLPSRHLNFILVSFVFGGTHMAPNSLTLQKPLSDWLIMIQASALPGLSHDISVTGNKLNCWLKIDISMNLKLKKVTKKSLQQNEGHLPLVPYCTNQSTNDCMCSFLLPLIAYELICLSTQISQHYRETKTSLWDWNLNNIWVNMMPCTVSHFTAHGRHL